eukprot:COSAG01_NODE_7751_length_3071_cov_7.706595_1_plen_488_part_10
MVSRSCRGALRDRTSSSMRRLPGHTYFATCVLLGCAGLGRAQTSTPSATDCVGSCLKDCTQAPDPCQCYGTCNFFDTCSATQAVEIQTFIALGCPSTDKWAGLFGTAPSPPPPPPPPPAQPPPPPPPKVPPPPPAVDCVGEWTGCQADCAPRRFVVSTQRMGSGRRCAAADGAAGAECSPGEGACPPPRRRSRAVACVGVWSACGASCEKVFSITTAAAGGGAACEADADDTFGCAPGEGACPPAEPPPPPPPPPLPSLPAPPPPLPPLTPSPPSDASQEPQPAGNTAAIQHNVAQWEDTAPMQLLPVPAHSAMPTGNADDCCPTAPRLLYASGSLLFCAGAVLCLMSASLASCWCGGPQDDGSEASPQESPPLSGWLALACVAVSGGLEAFWTLCLASYTAHAVPFSIFMGCMAVVSMAASLVLHFHARSRRHRRRGSHSGSHISGSKRDCLHCRNTPLAVSVVLVGAAVLELALVSGLATRPDILD